LKPPPAISIAPLGEDRHAVRFTIDQRMLDKIRQAQALLRHQLPTGDLVILFERALDLLIAERMNKLWGHSAKPKPHGSQQRRRSVDIGRSAVAAPGANITPPLEAIAAGAANPHADASAVTEPSVATDATKLARRKPQTVVTEPSVATDATKLARRKPQTVEASTPDALGRLASSSSAPGIHTNYAERVPQASRTHALGDRQVGVTRPKNVTPRTGRARANSRYVGRAVRRELLQRDGAQCTFVGPDGHRCTERGWLQRDHKTPYARGGPSSLENLRLRCRAHNLLEAERTYSRAFVLERIAAARAKTPPAQTADGLVRSSDDPTQRGPERARTDEANRK
jgi:5-methylcytosine-specific restriction endonuclease McrA